jgi:hypothetical protein
MNIRSKYAKATYLRAMHVVVRYVMVRLLRVMILRVRHESEMIAMVSYVIIRHVIPPRVSNIHVRAIHASV